MEIFLAVSYFTWKLAFVSNVLSMAVVPHNAALLALTMLLPGEVDAAVLIALCMIYLVPLWIVVL